jgi:hypothetical protein
MKPFLYNPVIGGEEIEIDGKTYRIDEYIPCTDQEAIVIKEHFPFLVDMREERYQPEFHSQHLKNKKKSLWATIKHKIFATS